MFPSKIGANLPIGVDFASLHPSINSRVRDMVQKNKNPFHIKEPASGKWEDAKQKVLGSCLPNGRLTPQMIFTCLVASGLV